jgi:hypothetical protein
MVKVFTTLFGMENWHNGACNTGSYKLPGQYYCSPKPSELVTCGVLGAAACQFSVNVTDETMPTSKFKELVR